ncbi:hypothetical protein HDU91_002077, partial [Kappamyces sp. JEL0680]
KLDNNTKRTEIATRKKNTALALELQLRISAPVTGLPATQDLETQLAKFRRILIKDLVSIFKLRKVQRKVKGGDSPSLEYRIVTVGCPTLSQLTALPSSSLKKINAFTSYVTQMTILLSHYLGVYLPHRLYFADGIPMVCLEPNLASGVRPLVLDVSNSDSFVVGFSVLNYNLAYLCASQDVPVPLDRTSATLDLLACLCEAPNLGSPGPKTLPLEYDVQDVIDFHIQLSQRPWEVIDMSDDVDEVSRQGDVWDVVDMEAEDSD